MACLRVVKKSVNNRSKNLATFIFANVKKKFFIFKKKNTKEIWHTQNNTKKS